MIKKKPPKHKERANGKQEHMIYRCVITKEEEMFVWFTLRVNE